MKLSVTPLSRTLERGARLLANVAANLEAAVDRGRHVQQSTRLVFDNVLCPPDAVDVNPTAASEVEETTFHVGASVAFDQTQDARTLVRTGAKLLVESLTHDQRIDGRVYFRLD